MPICSTSFVLIYSPSVGKTEHLAMCAETSVMKSRLHAVGSTKTSIARRWTFIVNAIPKLQVMKAVPNCVGRHLQVNNMYIIQIQIYEIVSTNYFIWKHSLLFSGRSSFYFIFIFFLHTFPFGYFKPFLFMGPSGHSTYYTIIFWVNLSLYTQTKLCTPIMATISKRLFLSLSFTLHVLFFLA